MTSTTTDTTSLNQTSSFQYKDIGIILTVKPRINEGGLVSLDLKQEISSYFVQPLSTGTSTQDAIVVNKTEASTNLVVQDNHTIIIGGLIREDNSDARNGIPVLSKIPILGFLFGDTNESNRRTELIILLTPRVIKSLKSAQDVTKEYIDSITNLGKGRITRGDLLMLKKPSTGPSDESPAGQAKPADTDVSQDEESPAEGETEALEDAEVDVEE